ncbi:WYL domain-containing protein [Nocardia sp. NBC_00416]|uniref:WYL domain-containing protein n=1 Tax=Nocardia sp. NBC_00416 TaxID=2975991 RepID=UPI003FA568F6
MNRRVQWFRPACSRRWWDGGKSTVRYQGRDDATDERAVDPWGLVDKDAIWYAAGVPSASIASCSARPVSDLRLRGACPLWACGRRSALPAGSGPNPARSVSRPGSTERSGCRGSVGIVRKAGCSAVAITCRTIHGPVDGYARGRTQVAERERTGHPAAVGGVRI